MDYLITKIIACLLIAFVLGLFISWLIQKLSNKQRENELEKQLRSDTEVIKLMEEDRDHIAAQLQQSNDEIAALNKRIKDIANRPVKVKVVKEAPLVGKTEVKIETDANTKIEMQAMSTKISDLTMDYNLTRKDRDHVKLQLQDATRTIRKAEEKQQSISNELDDTKVAFAQHQTQLSDLKAVNEKLKSQLDTSGKN